MNIIRCASPFGADFKEAAKTFHTIKRTQKIAVVIASIVCGIFTPMFLFTGAFLAFTKSIQYFQSRNSKLDSKTSEVADSIIGSSNKNSVDKTSSMNKNPKLSSYGLSESEYDEICHWYEQHRANLVKDATNLHLPASLTGLKRTVIYVAEGPHKGLHIRTKITLGVGAYNKATRTLHIDTGKPMVARAGIKNKNYKNELKSNEKYAAIDPKGKYFAKGSYVIHKGKAKDRNKISSACQEIALPADITSCTKDILQETDIDKVTYIMDEMPDGELRKDLRRPLDKRKRTPEQYLQILIHLTEGLILAHEKGMVDLDYKPANILMDGSIPKMADFGMAYSKGVEINGAKGTLGFISPEMASYKSRQGKPLIVQPANQIWIHGCIMALMFKGKDFKKWTAQNSLEDMSNVTDPEKLKAAIDEYFPKNTEKGSIDWCIAQCLQYKPEKRLKAEELKTHLSKIKL